MSSKARQTKGPLLGLLLVFVTSAALLAYFGSRSASRRAPSAPRPQEADSAAPSSRDAPRPSELPPPPKPAGVTRTLLAGVPTPEEAAQLRGPQLEANPDVAKRGIDALVPELRCTPPSVPETGGRSGSGGVGCVIRRDKEGQADVRVGRWALRQEDGIVSVGDFEFGERAGEWIDYYPNGFKAAEGEFDQGGRTGVWNEWDPSGIHVARRTYEKGAPHGVTIVWYGARAVVDVWEHGERVSRAVAPPPEEPTVPAPE